jgi:hypothetical protein
MAIFLEGLAGSYEVSSIQSDTAARIINLGYPGNASPGTVIPPNTKISPSGFRGPNGGGGGGGGTLNALSPTTSKGDLIVDNGSNNPSANDVRFAVGSNGKALVADSTQATGLNYATITPNTAATDKSIATFNGTSGTPVPLQVSSMVVTSDGALQSTPTGGNARGTKAVDLQVDRAVATQVASGNNSVIAGGKSNIATALYSSVGGGVANAASGQASAISGGTSNSANSTNAAVLGGTFNTAGASSAVVLGGTANQALGSASVCLGGNGNVSNGQYSVSVGGQSSAQRYGEFAHSGGQFAQIGDAQESRLLMRGTTTNATPTQIFLDGAAALILLANKQTLGFRMLISARRTDAASESAAFQLLGCIDQQTGAATCRIVGSVTKTVIARDDAAWDVAATADSTNGALILTVTGENAKNIIWVAMVELTQVQG